MNSGRTFIALVTLAATLSCTVENADEVVGLLESDRIELTAEFSEVLLSREVREGETVQSGQLLLRQDESRMQAALAEVEAQLAETEARLAELLRGPRPEVIRAARAEVSGARDEVNFTLLELQRTQEIFDRQLAAKETVDRAQVAHDAALARQNASEARLEELLAGTTVEELRQVEARLAQRRAQRDLALINLERLQIRAPVNGVVDTLLLETGERPQPGKPVAVILAGAQPYARVYVPEAMRVQITPGTAASVAVDGLPEALDGRVRWVASEAAFTPYFALTEHDRGGLTYAAKIDLDVTGKRLPDGVPVQVQFEVTAGAISP